MSVGSAIRSHRVTLRPIVALLCHTTHCNLPGILRGAGTMTYALPAPQAWFRLFSGMSTALPYAPAR